MNLLTDLSWPTLLLRGTLLAGLVSHKVLWEALKKRSPLQPTRSSKQTTASVVATTAKAVKIMILLGLLGQLFLSDVLPIATDARSLRVGGVVLYGLGWMVAILARIQLGRNWSNIEAAAVLEQQQVVRHGLYRYVRHPIYTGDLLLLLGFELALNSWLVLGVLLLAPIVLSQAIREEALLKQSLPGYCDYCRTTRRFIPFIV